MMIISRNQSNIVRKSNEFLKFKQSPNKSYVSHWKVKKSDFAGFNLVK
jgi:hypothetical protein